MELFGSEGSPCGTCGELLCLGTDELSCVERPPNACGGCGEIEESLGRTCGTCGLWACGERGEVGGGHGGHVHAVQISLRGVRGRGALEALEWGRHKSVAEKSGEPRSDVSSAHQNQPRRAVSSFSRLTFSGASSRRGSRAVTRQGRSMSSKASHTGVAFLSNGTQAPFSAFFGKGKVAPAETLPVASPDGTVPRY